MNDKINKLIFFLLLPLAVNGQNPVEKSTKNKSDSAATISIATVDAQETDPYQRIEGYRQRVISGEDMSKLARLYSEDPGSAPKGGIYLNVARGVFVPEFEAVAFRLRPGEVSEVFKTQFGYHFIQLLDRHGETVDLRHILVAVK